MQVDRTMHDPCILNTRLKTINKTKRNRPKHIQSGVTPEDKHEEDGGLIKPNVLITKRWGPLVVAHQATHPYPKKWGPLVPKKFQQHTRRYHY